MSNRAKLFAALGAAAAAGFALAALLLPVTVPAAASADVGQMAGASAICSAASRDVAPFYSEVSIVNFHMHEGMTAAPSGNVDRDFIRMMIPHHQGAIDMARALLKYSHDEKLKRLAQSIVVEQAQEIAYMRTLLDAPAAPSSTDNTAHP